MAKYRTRKYTADLIVLMGKLMVLWSIFLLIFEVTDWFGVNKPSLRALDEMAMIITALLFIASTLGVRYAVRRIERHRTPPSESPC